MVSQSKNTRISAGSGSNRGAITREGISIPQLRSVFNGRVIAPGDAGYDEARTVFYGGIDRQPAW